MTRDELQKVADEYVQRILEGKGAKRPGINAFDGIIMGLAEKNHEAWCEAKRADGYVYGEVVDDVAKTTNLLVPFKELPESIKESNIRNAKKTISLVLGAGFKINKVLSDKDRTDLLISMAEALHDEWVLGKAKKGYVYGTVRNDYPEKGQLTHRDMLPFAKLVELYPEDAAYDMQTANGILNGIETAGFAICYSDGAVATA